MRGPVAGAGCAGAERRVGIGRAGVLSAGVLEYRDAAGQVPIISLAFNCPVLAGLSPAGRGGRCTDRIAPLDKSLFGFVFTF